MYKRLLSIASALGVGLAVASAASADDISFSTWQHDSPTIGEWWKTIVSDYEEQTGNDVDVRNLPVNEYFQQLIIELANRSAADVVLTSGFFLAEYASGGHLLPLDEMIDNSPVADLIQEGAWEGMRMNGQIYAVPVAGRTLELIYNRCLLEEAGFDGPPTTIQEWRDMAEALTVRDENGNVTQFGTNMLNTHEDPTYEFLLMLTIAMGGDHFSDADGNWQVTSEPVVAALELMKDMYDARIVPRGVNESDQRALFATGKSAMTIDGQWQFPFIEETNPDNYDCYESARHPWDGPATGGPNTLLTISAASDNVESAWSFIELATSSEFQQTFGDFSPIIPLGKEAITEDQLEKRPYLGPWLGSIADARQIPPPGHETQFSQVWQALAGAVVESLQTGVEPAEALAAAEAELEECCGS